MDRDHDGAISKEEFTRVAERRGYRRVAFRFGTFARGFAPLRLALFGPPLPAPLLAPWSLTWPSGRNCGHAEAQVVDPAHGPAPVAVRRAAAPGAVPPAAAPDHPAGGPA